MEGRGYRLSTDGTVDPVPAMDAAACVIVLLSPEGEIDRALNAIVDRALERKRPILPVRLDGPRDGALARRLATFQPIDAHAHPMRSLAGEIARRFETGWSIFAPIARPFRPLGLSPWTLAGLAVGALVAAILVFRPFDPAPLSLADLRVDDFRPRVTDFETDGERGRWRVDLGASPRLIAAGLLDRIDAIELSVDGRTFVVRRFFPAPIEGAAGADTLHLRLTSSGGAIAGPFRYSLDFIAEAQARMKTRIEEGGWTRCSRATCFLRFLRNAGAVRELRWGFDDGPLVQRARIEVPVERFDDIAWIEGSARIPHQIMIPRGVQRLRFQVVYADGSEGAIQQVPVAARP